MIDQQKKMWRIYFLLSILWASGTFIPKMMSVVSFYTNVSFDNTIDLATAFTVLILFDKINNPMIMLPIIIGNTLELLVSLKRIQTFMDSTELKIDNFLKINKDTSQSENAVIINNSSFSWGLKSEEEKDEKKEEQDKKDK